MRRLLILPLLVLGFAGCKSGPDYQRPAVSSPDGWRTAAPTNGSLANVAWWSYYRDPVLTNLITAALTNNYDLRIAAARIAEAQGGYIAQRSFLLPTVSGSGAWTRARAGDIPPSPGAISDQFDVFGLLSYEVDLWGRLRRLTESARAQLLASEEAQKTVQISLISSVATTYFTLRALDRQLEIAHDTYVSRTNSLELTRIKFNEDEGLGYGIVSELDVRQAETQVYAARSTIASLERAVAVTENALRYLLGQNPGDIPRGQSLADQWQPVEIPAGLPSDLLLRRPDLRTAEQQLIAANADIGAARAAYFPTVSLTAALGVQSVELDDLFSGGASRAWSFAPQIVAPIFNGGRIGAGVQVAQAREQAALAVYGQAIQNAFREVDDAIVSITKLREQLAAEEANARAETRRLELSQLRYDEGIASYSDVLDAQRFLFSAELGAVQTRKELLAAVAQLYKALGGGWTLAETPAAPAAAKP
jgi:multidrug efflux system outer membrane protein